MPKTPLNIRAILNQVFRIKRGRKRELTLICHQKSKPEAKRILIAMHKKSKP